METAQVTLLVRKNLQGAANFVDAYNNYYPDQLYCTPEGPHA
jgi:hypothetical protein